MVVGLAVFGGLNVGEPGTVEECSEERTGSGYHINNYDQLRERGEI